MKKIGVVHIIGPENGFTQPGMTIFAATAILLLTALLCHRFWNWNQRS
jgi:hypothetical protein